MAFCNSCGATLDGGAKFCTKCGATQPGRQGIVGDSLICSVSGSTATTAAPQEQQRSQDHPDCGRGDCRYRYHRSRRSFVHRLPHRHRSTRVRNRDGNVRVETPFGTVQSTTDPGRGRARLWASIRIPEPTVVKGTTSKMNMGNMHTAAADFETSDSPSTVADFYKSKVPGANVISSESDHYAIISTDKKNMLTINIEPKDGKTRIHIAKVSGKMVNGGDSDN